MKYTKKHIEKLKLKSTLDTSSGCIEWNGYRNPKGYGQIGIGGKVMLVHRVAYEIAYGIDLGELCCLHSCDNPSCINSEHLFAGTVLDNNLDMLMKGRQVLPPVCKGSKNGQAALDEDDVITIKRDLATKTCAQLGREFSVCRTTISKIKNNINWSYIN